MQDAHKGVRYGLPPLLDVAAWLIDSLHEQINIVEKLFSELIWRACCHDQAQLDAMCEALRQIKVTCPALQKVPRNSTAALPKEVSLTLPHLQQSCTTSWELVRPWLAQQLAIPA